MKNTTLISFVLLMLAGIPEARSQSEELPPVRGQTGPLQQPTFRASANLVALNVTVMDGGKLVTGLRSSDFEVYEDGVMQQVRFFEDDDLPLDLILLLDTSSSMRPHMPVVHKAARESMKTLRPAHRGAVVAFNERVRVLQPLTSDPAAVESAIDSATAYGSTALYNAIYVALKQFGRAAIQRGELRRQAIAVLSDGEDTTSLVTYEDVQAAARRSAVNIYTIALTADWMRTARSSFSTSTYAMKTLARETGARSFFPSTVHELKRVYASIADEVRAQYSLAYSPTNARPDGRFRRIVVRVPDRPGARPRTRLGYSGAHPDRQRHNLLIRF